MRVPFLRGHNSLTRHSRSYRHLTAYRTDIDKYAFAVQASNYIFKHQAQTHTKGKVNSTNLTCRRKEYQFPVIDSNVWLVYLT